MAIKGAEFNGDQELNEILSSIETLLKGIDTQRKRNPISIFYGEHQIQKYYRGWTEVQGELHRFVEDPKQRYRHIMDRIDEHKKDLPEGSVYRSKLDSLATFLAKGPTFSSDYQCTILQLPPLKKE